jgi:glucose 1-dehydrogenase
VRLQGKVALVTGAAQGIGRAIARRLAEEGADIAVNGRVEDERTAAACAEIEATGRRCAVVAGDIAVVDAARDVVARALHALGRLDILVNNAGIERRAAFLDATERDFDAQLAVNLKAAFFLAQAFAQQAKDAGRGGKVINISSVHEELPFPHFAAYCASKGGLKMLMRDLAIELAPLGITVNNIAPGAIATPINAGLLGQPALLEPLLAQIPLGRLGRPEDVAGVAAFLASSDADYVTGATVVVDGGLLWHYEEQ